MAAQGTKLSDVRRVLSFPVATAQCRKYLAESLPAAEVLASQLHRRCRPAAWRAPRARQCGHRPAPGRRLYGLAVLAEDVEDFPGNQTRFVAVARSGVPRPTGHDRTSIVCFQRDDRPGSLHGILGQFAARNINLTKLESRPTKRGLGDYCFVIDLDGHLDDEVVADCLRDLHAELAGVKFLGSYAAAGAHAPARRREADDAWRQADAWLSALRDQIG